MEMTSATGNFSIGATVAPGTLTVEGSGSLFSSVSASALIGVSSTGTVTVRDSGRAVFTSPFGVQVAFNAGSQGTINIDGTSGSQGVLEAQFITEGAGTGAVNFNGGILRALASTSLLQNFEAGDVTIINNSTIDTNGFNASVTADIDGTGRLIKTGAGTLTLSGTNTYSGTSISAGVLSVSQDANLGVATSGLNMANGSTLRTTATFATSRNIGFFGNATVDVVTGILTHGGVLVPLTPGTTLTKTGAGTLVLTGNNNLPDLSAIAINGGVVSVAQNSNLGPSFSTLRFDGGTLETTAGFTMSRATTLNAGGGTIDVTTGTLTQNGVISGTGGLTKSGTGTLVLSGANTYTGGTTVTGGTLQAGAAGAFVDNTAYTVDGGTLDLNDFALTASSLAGTGGTVDLGAGTLTVDQAVDTTYAGVIAGTGSLTKTGTGTLTLSGANTYTGGTTVIAGTLQAGAAGAFVDNTAYTVDGGTLDLNDFALTASSLSGAGGTVDLGTAALTVDQAANTTYAGVIAGTGGLTKTGTGTLVLSGANTYTGGTTVTGGTLQAGAAGAFVDNTAYTVDGGTLDLNDFALTASSLAGTGGTVDLGTAALTVDQTANTTYAGVIAGTGGLTKTGAGMLVLSGANTYTGGTTVTDGTLQAGAAGAFVDNTAYTVDGGTLDLNDFALTASSLSGAGGTVDLGAGTLTVDQAVDTTYAGVIAGTGNLIKSGTGSLTLTASNTWSGATTVSSGILINNGGLGATAVTVGGAGLPARLTGLGNYGGSVTVASLGILARTGALGTATNIAGNLNFTGGTLEVRYESPMLVDRFNVGGSVTIGAGSTFELVIPGPYTPPAAGEVITVVDAAGGVTGMFDTVILPAAAALDFQVGTTATQINLNAFPAPTPVTPAATPGGAIVVVVTPIPYTAFAETRNQMAVAGALQRERLSNPQGDMALVIGVLNMLPTGDSLRGAFDQIAPTFYSAFSTLAFNQSDTIGINLRDRISAARLGTSGLGGAITMRDDTQGNPLLADTIDISGFPLYASTTLGAEYEASHADHSQALLSDAKLMTASPDNKWGFFASGAGTFGSVDANTTQPGFDFDTGWLNLGANYRVGPNFLAGAYAGYAGTETDFGSLGDADVDSAKFGIFASWFQNENHQEKGGAYVDATVGGAYNSYDLDRNIVFTGINRTATATPTGIEFTTAGTAGYDIVLGDAKQPWIIGPFSDLRYTALNVDGFTETGAGALSLILADQHAESLLLTLGSTIRKTFELPNGFLLIPSASAAWQHEFFNADQAINAAFAGGAGEAFGIQAGDIGRDNVLLGAGLTMVFNETVSAYLNYNAYVGRANFSAQEVTGGVTLAF
jgi:autotransporter-associated beta strand protein